MLFQLQLTMLENKYILVKEPYSNEEFLVHYLKIEVGISKQIGISGSRKV
jgi:hypothetical protein